MTDWEAIVGEHGPMAFETAWRILGHAADTEDAVQDALLQAFDLHRSQSVSNWGGLLRHLAACRALDQLRRRTPRPLEFEPVAGPGGQPHEEAAARELAERLRVALVHLPDQEARVFSLKCFGELSNSEISEQLGISAGAVGVALHKARRRLRELLKLEASSSPRIHTRG